MHLFVLHHHLQTGGVTRVIQSQLKSYEQLDFESVTLITSRTEDSILQYPNQKFLPELQYLNRELTDSEREQIRLKILQFLIEQLSAKPNSILHIHNVNLGKNPILNLCIYELAQQGFAIVNHCHDFAEDNRPKNLEHLKAVIEVQYKLPLNEVLYSKNIYYAVINRKDQDRLQQADIPISKILYLPNAIDLPQPIPPQEASNTLRETFHLDQQLPIFLYPVRVIRRKNIAELILFSCIFREKGYWMATQAPQNPEELPAYLDWKEFCHQNEIPLLFEVGQKLDFNLLMSGADIIITTSISEGFGMTFLEPWLYSKPVVGRDLPEITKDFKATGIQFPFLYQELKTESGEFSKLNLDQQKSWILKLKEDSTLAETWISQNSLDKLFHAQQVSNIDHNIEVIQKNYSLSSYGKTLKGFYEKLF